MTIPIEQATINLAVALGLSAVIGFERQWRNRLAGLRTNTLIALGVATFVIFAALIPGEASPTRVAAQVVSGIGFHGARLIFREGLSVRGLQFKGAPRPGVRRFASAWSVSSPRLMPDGSIILTHTRAGQSCILQYRL
jgi:hypothetical protein